MIVDVAVTNNTPGVVPMVIADLPIPAGFRLEGDKLDRLADSGTIANYEVTARSVIVYLRRQAPKERLELRYRLRATMPVRTVTQPASVYEYYNADVKSSTGSEEISVAAAG